MLHWQHNLQDKNKVIAFTSACLIYSLLIVFFGIAVRVPTAVAQQRLNINLSRNKIASPVVFGGSRKSHKAEQKAAQKQASSTSVTPDSKKVKKKKSSWVKKIPKKSQSAPSKKATPQKAKPQKKKKQKLARASTKKTAKPAIKPRPKKKDVVKKKKTAAPKKVVKKKLEKKDISSQQKKHTTKVGPVAPIKPTQQKKDSQKIKKMQQTTSSSNSKVTSTQSEDVAIGEQLEIADKDQLALNKSILRSWHHPRGIADNLTVRIEVMISKDGRVSESTIIKSSGVPAYDMAARAALWRSDYPRAYWGKQLSLIFGKE